MPGIPVAFKGGLFPPAVLSGRNIKQDMRMYCQNPGVYLQGMSRKPELRHEMSIPGWGVTNMVQ
jgi:hypothetical protein